MLTVARAAAEQEGLVIEWHEGQAEKLPFPDRSFDVVLCQFARSAMSQLSDAMQGFLNGRHYGQPRRAEHARNGDRPDVGQGTDSPVQAA
jgi:hypothetical protein